MGRIEQEMAEKKEGEGALLGCREVFWKLVTNVPMEMTAESNPFCLRTSFVSTQPWLKLSCSPIKILDLAVRLTIIVAAVGFR